MPSVFSLIGTSWEFYKKQPVLNMIIFWLFFLPTTVFSLFELRMEAEISNSANMPVTIVYILGMVVLVAITLWGQASVLQVGTRLLKSKAGRSRTSFKGVCAKSVPFIIPLFLTSILYTSMMLLWSLLLIVPGIIYMVRAFFYDVIIVVEGKQYREALRLSTALCKGKTLTVFGYLFSLYCICVLAPIVPLGMIQAYLDASNAAVPFHLISIIMLNGISSIATMVFALCSIALYGHLKNGDLDPPVPLPPIS